MNQNHVLHHCTLTPPDVGAAEASSAIDIPTNRMKILATSHWRRICEFQVRETQRTYGLTPQTIADGPPSGMEYTRTELDRQVRNVRYITVSHLRDRWEQSNDTECDTERLEEQIVSYRAKICPNFAEKNDVETPSTAGAG